MFVVDDVDDDSDDELKPLATVFPTGAQPLPCERLCKGVSKEAP